MLHLNLHRLLRTALGALLLLGLAEANAAPKAYVGNFKDNTVSVIDSAAGVVTATIPIAAGPHGMGVTPDGRWLFVSGDASTGVSVVDTATDRVVQTIEVGKSPHGVALTPDGKQLLVGVYGDNRVAIVDIASSAVVATVPVGNPHTIAIRPDGRFAYVASQAPGKFALVVIDLATRAVTDSIALDKPARDLEFASNGKALYFTLAGVNAVQVLDPGSNKVVAQIATGVSPHLATVFRGATVGTAVVQGSGELLLFDPATFAPIKSIPVGKQPHWMASGDGKTVYVTNEGSNDVSVVDITSGLTRTIAVGNAPRKVAVQAAPIPAAAAPKVLIVSISNFVFAPAEIVIAAGGRVEWSNDDGAPHGLAFKDGAPGVDPLLPGARFSRVFDLPGTYDYVCSVHPFMAGRVVVRAR